MPRATSTSDHSHTDLEQEVAELRKEVAALKAQLSKRPARSTCGADPRVDKLVDFIKTQFGDERGPEKRQKIKDLLSSL